MQSIRILSTQAVVGALYVLIFHFWTNPGLMAQWQATLLFGLGLGFGVALLWLDERFLLRFYHEDDLATPQLVTRSLLFLVTLVPLALFMITSTGSLVGVGTLLGLGFGLALEMLFYRPHPELFQTRFLFQIKKTFSDRDQLHFISIVWVLLLLFSLMALW